jgi:UDP-N-acetylglucosamine/UDP-N-acetylgalactosamine diphosphorylase
MVVAGGQGSRLGFPGPKGLYPLGPVTGRTLFALQAQRIRRLRERTGAAIPWYVMTSEATDDATRSAFAEAGHFGLPPRDVFFLRQGMVTSFDFDGKLMLERPDRIMENPDGHGGALTALLGSGALDDMQHRGTDTLFYYQVDNPLVRMADPVFLGFHALAGAEMSCKVVRKRDALEKAGVGAKVDTRRHGRG